jgi:succinoglycan biosynthesis transport protein ExoP
MEAEKSLTMADYFAVFRRRRRLMLGIAMPIIALVTMFALALPSVYRSTAVFRLRDGDQNRQRYIDKYVANLTDYVMKLPRKEGEVPELNGGDLHVDMITSTILDPDSGHDKVILTGFGVSYDSRNPVNAYKGADWLSKAFLQAGREDALSTVASQITFYDKEAEHARTRVSEIESKVAEFKRVNFEQLPESGQANLNVKNQTDQELVNVDREISTQQQNRIFLMQQLQTAQSNSGTGANAAILEDEYKRRLAQYDASHPDMVAMRRQIETAKRGGSGINDGSLKTELEEQRAVLAETRLRYSEDHPDVRRLTANIKVIEARIARGEKVDAAAITGSTPIVIQLNTTIRATDNQIAALQTRRIQLQSKLLDMDRRLSATPMVEKQYEILNRDLATVRQQYQQLVNQRLEAELRSAAISAGTADAFTLVQGAWQPDAPYKPKRSPIIAVGFIIAGILAFMAAIAREMMDGTVRGSRDIVSILQVSPLAIVPKMRNGATTRRRRLQFATAGGGVLVALPLMYFVIRAMVQ